MEVEKIRKKNKRVFIEDVLHEEEEEEEADKEENSDHRLKKLKAGQETAFTGAGCSNSGVVPTEEEVEEFFAILRRMKVAVKYFHNKGKVGGNQWREELEQVDVTVDDDGTGVDGVVDGKKGGKVIINEGLDLNTVAPESSESGGA
ncbi:hypothetical protein TanjilG_22304 [Lupinus angustifolius]|uniref:Uncharacterized protein n=1 Tax=Lupinus angustifolius TaxID=3871 RepID=A0A1J7GSX8_LUPAN|nr:PREDICTED: uncharacterized protein LOC109358671 [Lupinus angustifolius]OIW03647.1 hypothetical protein TanjilG_22304 [Lupinus angustifolius]